MPFSLSDERAARELKEDMQRLEDCHAGQYIEHEAIDAWLRSIGTDDELPSPEELAFQDKKVKVTLSQASVDFFKAKAKKHHTSYQAMIRQLLDIYANR